MKKRLSQLLMAIAMLSTGAASVGCFYWLLEEPTAKGVFND